jgi:hypothetical protein
MVRRSSVARPLRLDDLSPRVVQVVRTRLARPGPRQAAPVHPRRAQAGDGKTSPQQDRWVAMLGACRPFFCSASRAESSRPSSTTAARPTPRRSTARHGRRRLPAACLAPLRRDPFVRRVPVGSVPLSALVGGLFVPPCDPFVGSFLRYPILGDQAIADAGLTGSVETFGGRSTGQGEYLRLRCFRRPVLAGSVGQYLSLSGRRLRHRHIRGH